MTYGVPDGVIQSDHENSKGKVNTGTLGIANQLLGLGAQI